MKKPEDLKVFPVFKTDAEAERFVDEAHLSQYDFSQFRLVHFEFEKKEVRVNMRLPKDLPQAVKDYAPHKGIPYQRFIRQVLERAVTHVKTPQRPKARGPQPCPHMISRPRATGKTHTASSSPTP